ncbi:hypothetical protein Tco_0393608 [Tanacetum coccineum]
MAPKRATRSTPTTTTTPATTTTVTNAQLQAMINEGVPVPAALPHVTAPRKALLVMLFGTGSRELNALPRNGDCLREYATARWENQLSKLRLLCGGMFPRINKIERYVRGIARLNPGNNRASNKDQARGDRDATELIGPKESSTNGGKTTEHKGI